MLTLSIPLVQIHNAEDSCAAVQLMVSLLIPQDRLVPSELTNATFHLLSWITYLSMLEIK